MSDQLQQNGCIICGKYPTVRSHILPKSLMRDMVQARESLTAISMNTDRPRLSQSGLIDANLLCGEHERATELFDKYGVEFCRTFKDKAQLTDSSNGFTVPNPKPNLLANFAYACVWRYAVSEHGRALALKLGRYEQILRKCIFEGADCSLPVIVGLSHLRNSQGDPETLCVIPFFSKAKPANRWVFTVGYLDFHVFCDRRTISCKLSGALANKDDPLLCGKTEGQHFTESRVLQPIINKLYGRN